MRQPPRFVIANDAINTGVVRIAGSELHHLRDVMRLQPGSEVTILDDTDVEYSGRVERLEPDLAIVRLEGVLHPSSHDAHRLILAVGLIKGPRMDALVEHAAELGAAELVTLNCTRSVVRDLGEQRLARWRRIATAAAKQSLAPRMEVTGPMSVGELVRVAPPQTLAIVCDGDAPPLPMLLRESISRETRPHQILLACGPEGGFDPGELALMRDAGFQAGSLGPNRLRSGTAALAALSIAAATIHELFGSS